MITRFEQGTLMDDFAFRFANKAPQKINRKAFTISQWIDGNNDLINFLSAYAKMEVFGYQ